MSDERLGYPLPAGDGCLTRLPPLSDSDERTSSSGEHEPGQTRSRVR